MIDTAVVDKVNREPDAFSLRSEFVFQQHPFAWTYIGNRHCSEMVAVFIVKVRDQMSREKDSKSSREIDLAILRSCRSQWPNHDSRVSDAVKFAPGTRWKPLRIERATLSGTQSAHRTIELRFEIERAGIRVGAERKNSIAVEPGFRTVGPENDRSFPGIRFAVF